MKIRFFPIGLDPSFLNPKTRQGCHWAVHESGERFNGDTTAPTTPWHSVRRVQH